MTTIGYFLRKKIEAEIQICQDLYQDKIQHPVLSCEGTLNLTYPH